MRCPQRMNQGDARNPLRQRTLQRDLLLECGDPTRRPLLKARHGESVLGGRGHVRALQTLRWLLRQARCSIPSIAMKQNFAWVGAFLSIVFAMSAQEPSASPPTADFDVIIRGGTVYDGTGTESRQADVAIRGDRIAGIGDFKAAKAKTVIDAKDLAVAPGFINMLSWSTESLIQDGRSQSEIRQGVTTEIMGEGESMGPVNDRVREHILGTQTDIKYDIKWNTLADYLQYLREARHLVQRGVVSRRDHRS